MFFVKFTYLIFVLYELDNSQMDRGNENQINIYLDVWGKPLKNLRGIWTLDLPNKSQVCHVARFYKSFFIHC